MEYVRFITLIRYIFHLGMYPNYTIFAMMVIAIIIIVVVVVVSGGIIFPKGR
jgi:hypothetical protein